MSSRWIWSGAALSMLVALATETAADEFADFRIPAHQVLDWSARLDVKGNRRSIASFPLSSRTRSFGASTSTSFSWLSDSDPRRTTVSAYAAAAGTGSWSSFSESPSSTFRRETQDGLRAAEEGWTLRVQHRRYPWAVPVGVSLEVAGQGAYRQQWADHDREELDLAGGTTTHELSRSASQTWRYHYQVATFVAVGIGRVRDATGIYDALVLEQRLQEAGALARPLSPEARRRLAALMFVRNPYTTFRERPAKHLWRMVSDILREDGALAEGGLDPYSILRAGEPHLGRGLTGDDLPRSPVARLTGCFLGPTLLDSHAQYLDRYDSGRYTQTTINDTLQPPFSFEGHARQRDSFDDLMGGAVAEFHRPLGPRWQLDATSQVLFPLRPGPDGFTLLTDGRATYLAADRWDVTASVVQSRSVLEEAGVSLGDSWEWSYGVSGNLYLEDHLQLTLAISETQSRRAGPGPSSHRSGGLFLGLGYRILGRFAAPGLVPLETLAQTR